MAINKRGKRSFVLPEMPIITTWASVAGKKESEGPLAPYFDVTAKDTLFGQKTWEQAEKQMQKIAMDTLLQKAGLQKQQVGLAKWVSLTRWHTTNWLFFIHLTLQYLVCQ